METFTKQTQELVIELETKLIWWMKNRVFFYSVEARLHAENQYQESNNKSPDHVSYKKLYQLLRVYSSVKRTFRSERVR